MCAPILWFRPNYRAGLTLRFHETLLVLISFGMQQHQSQKEEKKPAPLAADAPLLAALDLGTNNCRLLIARPLVPDDFKVVDSISRIVRLGEGVGETGLLSGAAIEAHHRRA